MGITEPHFMIAKHQPVASPQSATQLNELFLNLNDICMKQNHICHTYPHYSWSDSFFSPPRASEKQTHRTPREERSGHGVTGATFKSRYIAAWLKHEEIQVL